MLEQKRPDGDDSEQRVEFAQDECISLAGAQWLNTAL
jgi:hypothetical protein